MNIGDFFSTLGNVFRKKEYIIVAIIIAILFYSLNAFVASYGTLIPLYSQIGFFGTIKIFYSFLLGFRSTTFLHIYINIIILSTLLGILISLIYYKTKMLKEFSGETGALTTTGIFLGILAPGCAACGVGLLSLLGISAAAFSFLPYGGAEIAFLSTGIMFLLILKITKDIHEGIKCEIKP